MAHKIKVFFSYSHKDESLRDELDTHLAMLKNLNVIETWHDRKIVPGSEWEQRIWNEFDAADLILLLISADFLASEFCYGKEMDRAMDRHEAGHARAIPVLLRACDWAGAPFGKLGGLPTDMVPVKSWPDRDEAFLNVAEGIRTAVEEVSSGGARPTTPPPRRSAGSGSSQWPQVREIPHLRNPNFTGRQQLLIQLQKELTSGKAAALTAVHGMGGVGKTQLAIEYAYHHWSDYDVIWWVRSEEPAQLASDYAALAAALDLPEKDAREQQQAIDAVRHWLEQESNWLLIFDNVPDPDAVRNYLPRAATGHVIVTSRNPNWGGVATEVSVEVWPRDESIAFLLQRTEDDDRAAADALAQELGDLPLALDQAAAYIEATGQSLAPYLEIFRDHQKELLSTRSESADYPHSFAAMCELSIQRLEEESPVAADLLNLCAFFAPDDIPLDIIREGSEHLPETLAATAKDDLAWNDALAALRRYSLCEVSGDALSVHRLVQAIARDRLGEEAVHAYTQRGMDIVSAAFPHDSDWPENWPLCARLTSHAIVSADHAEAIGVGLEKATAALNQAGLYLQGRAQLSEAKVLLERALRIDEAIYGLDHPDVATAVNNLGAVLQDQGDLAGARQHFERALNTLEAAYGLDHTSAAGALNNLGTVLRELGDLEGAREYFERALHIEEAARAPEHPNVATALNNLGTVLQELGDLEGARAHFERALRIDEAAYGPNHPHVGMRAGNLGEVTVRLGYLNGGRSLLEQALRILRASYGERHPNVAIGHAKLGRVLQTMNDYDGARDHYRRAFETLHDMLGPDHRETLAVAEAMNSLPS